MLSRWNIPFEKDVIRNFSGSSFRIGWTMCASTLGIYFLSSISVIKPFLFESFWILLVFSTLSMDLLAMIYPDTPEEHKKKWLIANFIMRISIYFFGSLLISLHFKYSEGLNWGFLLGFGIIGGSIETIVSMGFPYPRFCYIHLASFVAVPLVYFFQQESSESKIIGTVLLFYTLNMFQKIRGRYKAFCQMNNLKEAVLMEKVQLEDFMDLIPAAISWMDQNLNYIRVNQKLADSLGMKKTDFLGKSYGFTDPFGEESNISFLRSFLASEQKSNKLIIPVRLDGEHVRRHELYLEKINRTGDHHQDLLMMGIDVEDHLLAEENLAQERAKQVHAARLSSLGEMASGIAHEIKNPLAIIGGANSLIQMELNRGESLRLDKIQDKTKQIDKTLKRIVQIIEGMRKLSRGENPEDECWVSVPQLMGETLTFCEESLRLAGVDIKIQQQFAGFEIYGQSAQISQVILNMISNAKDVLRPQEDRRIRVTVERLSQGSQAGCLEISIKDSGPGAVNPEKLFTPFYTTKDPGQGTGLGLSISKKIMQNHGGDLSYARESGMTVFKLTFPSRRVRTRQEPQVA